jgi:hypothetical protein
MEMKHGLSRARAHVEYRSVSLLDVALARDLRRRQMATSDDFGILSLRFFQSGKVFLWDNQHMRRCLGIDIFKGEYMLVVINLLGRNLAAKNAAEKAIGGGIDHG